MSKLLKGKIINNIKISDDEMAILFICEDGEHVALADADCCSHTWVENIELPALGFPCTVIDCFEVDMDKNEWVYEDFVQYYGYSIITDKGEIFIDYRNESNGYYGGDLLWPGEYDLHGSAFGQNQSTMNWVEVKEN